MCLLWKAWNGWDLNQYIWYRTQSANCGENLLKWARDFKNWDELACLNIAIEDAESVYIVTKHTHWPSGKKKFMLIISRYLALNGLTSRFNEYLKKLESDWLALHKGKEVYISHNKTLAEISRLHVTDEETEKITDLGLMLWMYTLPQ